MPLDDNKRRDLRIEKLAKRLEVSVEAVIPRIIDRGLEAFQADRDAERERAASEALNADVVIVTASQAEFDTLRQILDRDGLKVTERNGKFCKYRSVAGLGEWRVLWLHVSMGAFGSGGSAAKCTLAQVETSAATFFLLGIAFGAPATRVGDVLISKRICLYDSVNVAQSSGNVIMEYRREAWHEADSFWVERLRTQAATTDWTGAGSPEIRVGTLMSGGALVESALLRDALIDRASAAVTLADDAVVGGEMEAAGVAAGADRWVVVKGVCDLADGTSRRTDMLQDRRAAAMRNAAALVLGTLAATPRNMEAT